jgi:hypothetical protein
MILSQNKFDTLLFLKDGTTPIRFFFFFFSKTLFLKDFDGGTPIRHVDVFFFLVAEEEEEEEECAGR